eukprot:16451486-Heterocapsa_arctica.AAC.1
MLTNIRIPPCNGMSSLFMDQLPHEEGIVEYEIIAGAAAPRWIMKNVKASSSGIERPLPGLAKVLRNMSVGMGLDFMQMKAGGIMNPLARCSCMSKGHALMEVDV